MPKPIILHICAHLGGGVGRFYKGLLQEDKQYTHRFLLLERPRDVSLIPSEESWCLLYSLHHLYREILEAAIVQVEFWNHPLLYKLLSTIQTWPPCRLVLYSHILGLYPPSYLPLEIIELTDVLVLASKASRCIESVLDKANLVKIIPSFGGASRTVHVSRKSHQGFQITYIGTASFLKIHPEIISWNCQIHQKNKNVLFTFCTNDDSSHLQSQVPVELLPIFTFLQKVDDINGILSMSDVFGYPLQRYHYGTGEQSLLEAMGASLPIVVLDNPTESCIVKHGYSGIVAKSSEEYIRAILMLANYPDIGLKMGRNAKNDVLTFMSHYVSCTEFLRLYESLIELDKTTCQARPKLPEDPWDLFILSQGNDSFLFDQVSKHHDGQLDPFLKWELLNRKKNGCLVPSKGTIAHWYRHFPDDLKIRKVINIIKNLNEDSK